MTNSVCWVKYIYMLRWRFYTCTFFLFPEKERAVVHIIIQHYIARPRYPTRSIFCSDTHVERILHAVVNYQRRTVSLG